jgi:hypothetical protein
VLKSLEGSSLRALKSLEGSSVRALKSLEGSSLRALKSLEGSSLPALKSLEGSFISALRSVQRPAQACFTKHSLSLLFKSLQRDILYTQFEYMLSQTIGENPFTSDSFKSYSLKHLRSRIQFIKFDTHFLNI